MNNSLKDKNQQQLVNNDSDDEFDASIEIDADNKVSDNLPTTDVKDNRDLEYDMLDGLSCKEGEQLQPWQMFLSYCQILYENNFKPYKKINASAYSPMTNPYAMVFEKDNQLHVIGYPFTDDENDQKTPYIKKVVAHVYHAMYEILHRDDDFNNSANQDGTDNFVEVKKVTYYYTLVIEKYDRNHYIYVSVHDNKIDFHCTVPFFDRHYPGQGNIIHILRQFHGKHLKVNYPAGPNQYNKWECGYHAIGKVLKQTQDKRYTKFSLFGPLKYQKFDITSELIDNGSKILRSLPPS